MGEYAIGQPVPRFEDPRLVKGQGRYIADMTFPGMAFGYVLRSPHAHARIRSHRHREGESRARGARRCSPAPTTSPPASATCRCPAGLKRRNDVPGYRPRYPALVEDKVRMIGNYVAFVVAETYYQAVDASELIEVDYEPLPAAGLDRRCDSIPACRWCGRIARTISASSRSKETRKRPTRRSRARGACGQAKIRHQPRHRRDHGAARLLSASTSRPTAATPSIPRCSGPMCSRPSCRNSSLKVPDNKIHVCAATSAAALA